MSTASFYCNYNTNECYASDKPSPNYPSQNAKPYSSMDECSSNCPVTSECQDWLKANATNVACWNNQMCVNAVPDTCKGQSKNIVPKCYASAVCQFPVSPASDL
jgi:hypothetical protein